MMDYGSDTPIIELKRREILFLIKKIESIPDLNTNDCVRQLIVCLNQLCRITVVTPPITEIMIYLHTYKPVLHDATRAATRTSTVLQLLFQIQGDIQLAERKIRQFIRSGFVEGKNTVVAKKGERCE
ncbi:hypothetical protein ACTID9_23940 [Brevibacillus fluminis]|uniref:hypothetical protein n=1 Tax=Brevibacillus fluminis TaxID=511487 RepID=UPI003F8B0656